MDDEIIDLRSAPSTPLPPGPMLRTTRLAHTPGMTVPGPRSTGAAGSNGSGSPTGTPASRVAAGRQPQDSLTRSRARGAGQAGGTGTRANTGTPVTRATARAGEAARTRPSRRPRTAVVVGTLACAASLLAGLLAGAAAGSSALDGAIQRADAAESSLRAAHSDAAEAQRVAEDTGTLLREAEAARDTAQSEASAATARVEELEQQLASRSRTKATSTTTGKTTTATTGTASSKSSSTAGSGTGSAAASGTGTGTSANSSSATGTGSGSSTDGSIQTPESSTAGTTE
ncbi:hypothetical protein SAMN06264364_13735 [Quadrisphaera granulorum]|uniref:Uncharacterized protein n=1 Tax=Quadrisphaera granulorum TaxID=317664 RepID=A0A315ZQC3_9ACTN|nr:hypothetical protein [Quadrisphaera granulorum]PWJ47492.1 hypothetical protein BXY45_13735 [Quadrisphaera granulorum]SZE98793.1 hypothetical protein SAMN06264364_13735 [Quadrisphaera granulorum]